MTALPRPLFLHLLIHKTLPTPPRLLNTLLTLQHLIRLQPSKHPPSKQLRRNLRQCPSRTLILARIRKRLQRHLSILRALLPLRFCCLYRRIPRQRRPDRLLPSHPHTLFPRTLRPSLGFGIDIRPPINWSKTVGGFFCVAQCKAYSLKRLVRLANQLLNIIRPTRSRKW